MNNLTNERMEELLAVIMKKCLWQFHSRSWDRLRQNENILSLISQLLCGEPVNLSTPQERCYWVDAVYLAETYQDKFDWLSQMSKPEIKDLFEALKERLDFLTVTGSLNEELNDPLY